VEKICRKKMWVVLLFVVLVLSRGSRGGTCMFLRSVDVWDMCLDVSFRVRARRCNSLLAARACLADMFLLYYYKYKIMD